MKEAKKQIKKEDLGTQREMLSCKSRPPVHLLRSSPLSLFPVLLAAGCC